MIHTACKLIWSTLHEARDFWSSRTVVPRGAKSCRKRRPQGPLDTEQRLSVGSGSTDPGGAASGKGPPFPLLGIGSRVFLCKLCPLKQWLYRNPGLSWLQVSLGWDQIHFHVAFGCYPFQLYQFCLAAWACLSVGDTFWVTCPRIGPLIGLDVV